MARVWKRAADKSKLYSRWYLTWTDWVCTGGIWKQKQRTQLAFTDRTASSKLGSQLEDRALQKRMGMIDVASEQLAKEAHRPIGEHLGAFVDHIEARGRADRYVRQIRPRLDRLVQFIGAARLSDITADSLNQYILSLRKGDLSGFTLNEIIGTAKALTKWGVQTNRLSSDPLACVRKLEAKKLEKKRPRRALTAGEIAALLDAALTRPEREICLIRTGPRKGELSDKVGERSIAAARRTGQERVVAYLLALWTGLRRSELGQLEWQDVELETLPPRLRLRSLTTKAKRGDTIALHPEIATTLLRFRPDDCDPDDLVVSAVPGMRVLKADLKFAGIEFETAAGRADLHAMRKSLATMLAINGVGQRIAQHHLRHTDPRLTAGVYTDESLLPVASSIASLPWMGTSVKAG